MKSSVFSNHPGILPISFLFGIITILILQFVWLTNSYNMMKDELMDKCRQNLREAIDDELYLRIDSKNIKFSFEKEVQETNNPKETEVLIGEVTKAEDVNINLQNFTKSVGLELDLEVLDSLLHTKIPTKSKYNIRYSLSIIPDTLHLAIKNETLNGYKLLNFVNLDSTNRYDLVSENAIYARITSYDVVKMEITSISNAIIAKGKFIFAISFLLCCLLGLILYNQYKKYKHNKQVLNFLVSYNSSIMHNILSPINSILILADHIQDDHSETRQSNLSYYITFFVEQCSILEKNIRQVLTLARMGYTNIKLNPKPTPLKKFLSETFGFYEIYVATKNKHLDLSIRCEPEDLFVDMDQAYMKSVFANFIDNSIKYSSTHVVFNVECTQIKDRVQIIITDNGFGIPENNLDDLFERFKRGDSKNIDTQASFGLGLSYIKDITEAHKGSVTLNYTSEEKGTQFTILLPIRQESV